MPSYQLDRGVLENDLRRFAEELGIALFEGYAVVDIRLAKSGEALHGFALKEMESDRTIELRGRWAIDALGRRRFLQRKLKLQKAVREPISAAWFRVAGRIGVDDLVPADRNAWHGRVAEDRYLSTNHLMGNGYWVWLIPLCSGSTSLGIVFHEDFHVPSTLNNFDHCLQWLEEHEPALCRRIEGQKPLDFKFLRKFSYSSRQVFSHHRWACVGEAGVFSDPFYSPGTDLIGLGNTIATHLIGRDLRGDLEAAEVEGFNRFLLQYNDGITSYIQNGYPFFGNAATMSAKLLWDFSISWTLNCPHIFNAVFVDREKSMAVRSVVLRALALLRRAQAFFAEWAGKATGGVRFDFIDYSSCSFLQEVFVRNLKTGKSPGEVAADYQCNLDYLEELAIALFFLAVEDVLPERLENLPGWINAWAIGLEPERWEGDGLFQPRTALRDSHRLREELRALYAA